MPTIPGNQDDDSDSNTNNISYYPFAWVLIPIVFFGIIAVLLTCYRYRRRRGMQGLWGQNAQRQDLEQAPTNYQRPRGPGRAWSGRPRRLGLGVSSRDEGLNELGEAPPAYTASQKHPQPGAVIVDGVELRNIENSPGVATAPEAAATTMGAGTSGGLPRYEEARQREFGGTQPEATTYPTSELAAPPRAVLPSG